MKEFIVKRQNINEARFEIYTKDTNQLAYHLDLQEEGLWKKSYTVKANNEELVGTIKYSHEAFRLAKMPVIRGYLGNKEVFCVKREIQSLRDAIVAEGESIKTAGAIIEGNFKLYYKDACIATFQTTNGQHIVTVASEEPLVVLFAFALECF